MYGATLEKKMIWAVKRTEAEGRSEVPVDLLSSFSLGIL